MRRLTEPSRAKIQQNFTRVFWGYMQKTTRLTFFEIRGRVVQMPEGAFLTKSMKLTEYLRETQGEMKHVSWPSKAQTIAFTIVVILISIIVGYGLGAFDFGFTFLIKTFILQ